MAAGNRNADKHGVQNVNTKFTNAGMNEELETIRQTLYASAAPADYTQTNKRTHGTA